jgi:hypothetical protein
MILEEFAISLLLKNRGLNFINSRKKRKILNKLKVFQESIILFCMIQNLKF